MKLYIKEGRIQQQFIFSWKGK